MYLSEASLACVTNAILIIVLTELHYTVYSLSWGFLTSSFLCCTFLFLQSTTTCTLFFSSFFADKAIPSLSCAHHQTQIHAYFLHSEASSFFSYVNFTILSILISCSETWDYPSPMLVLSHAQPHSSHSLISCTKVSSWLCWPFLSFLQS